MYNETVLNTRIAYIESQGMNKRTHLKQVIKNVIEFDKTYNRGVKKYLNFVYVLYCVHNRYLYRRLVNKRSENDLVEHN